jgi:hypothetical protein
MANGKTGSIADAPPSTYSSWPVMKLAWSVQRRTFDPLLSELQRDSAANTT